MELKTVTIEIDDPKSVKLIADAASKVNTTPDRFVQLAVTLCANQVVLSKNYAEYLMKHWENK